MKRWFFLIALLFMIITHACDFDKGEKTKQNVTNKKTTTLYHGFNADSSYNFVKRQVDFGPRVPGSEAHGKCADFLAAKLNEFCDTVITQNFKARVYTNEIFDGINIVGSINPAASNRILVCSHWDSRPYADMDEDVKNHNTPIPGANDGASGVGVILELARQLQMERPNMGVDFLLLDMEDYGPKVDYDNGGESTEHFWGLGAQYWGKNPHVYGYKARFGILLDMVGNASLHVMQEQYSQYYAKNILDKVWTMADTLGYADVFVKETGGIVTDDHVFINELTGIPTVDIIHQNLFSKNGLFFDQWHTLEDDIHHIDPQSLKIVGDVVLNVIRNEK